MQAVILAGGLGTRLWPLTKQIPKPMVPVAGAPYLEHQLRLLAKQSITDIVMLTGYLGSQIEEHFGDGASRWTSHPLLSRAAAAGYRRRAPRSPSPAGRLVCADLWRLVFTHSTTLKLPNRLAASQATGVMVVYRDPVGETSVRSNVALDESGLVSRYDKTAVDDPELQYIEAGVLAFRRAVLELIPPEDPVSLEQQVFPLLIERRQLIGMPTSQRFYDIGTPERLKAIEEFLT